jgi:hypothetical protein
MIYYRKTLFGNGPKLTAVQKLVTKQNDGHAELLALVKKLVNVHTEASILCTSSPNKKRSFVGRWSQWNHAGKAWV